MGQAESKIMQSTLDLLKNKLPSNKADVDKFVNDELRKFIARQKRQSKNASTEITTEETQAIKNSSILDDASVQARIKHKLTQHLHEHIEKLQPQMSEIQKSCIEKEKELLNVNKTQNKKYHHEFANQVEPDDLFDIHIHQNVNGQHVTQKMDIKNGKNHPSHWLHDYEKHAANDKPPEHFAFDPKHKTKPSERQLFENEVELSQNWIHPNVTEGKVYQDTGKPPSTFEEFDLLERARYKELLSNMNVNNKDEAFGLAQKGLDSLQKDLQSEKELTKLQEIVLQINEKEQIHKEAMLKKKPLFNANKNPTKSLSDEFGSRGADGYYYGTEFKFPSHWDEDTTKLFESRREIELQEFEVFLKEYEVQIQHQTGEAAQKLKERVKGLRADAVKYRAFKEQQHQATNNQSQYHSQEQKQFMHSMGAKIGVNANANLNSDNFDNMEQKQDDEEFQNNTYRNKGDVCDDMHDNQEDLFNFKKGLHDDILNQQPPPQFSLKFNDEIEKAYLDNQNKMLQQKELRQQINVKHLTCHEIATLQEKLFLKASALTRQAAEIRRRQLQNSDVKYEVLLKLYPGENYEGVAIVKFKYNSKSADSKVYTFIDVEGEIEYDDQDEAWSQRVAEVRQNRERAGGHEIDAIFGKEHRFRSDFDLFLDFKSDSANNDLRIKHIFVNGNKLSTQNSYINNNYIKLSNSLLQTDEENTVVVSFSNKYSKTGMGLHSYMDNDAKQYLYLQEQASRAFPCFDQPDIKGRLMLKVAMEDRWTAASNADSEYDSHYHYGHFVENFPEESATYDVITDFIEELNLNDKMIMFEESEAMSPSHFSLIAGPYKKHEFDLPTHIQEILPTSHRQKIKLREEKKRRDYVSKPAVNKKGEIYYRSCYSNYFLTNFLPKISQFCSNTISYFEEYFGVKYPFMKYRQFFVPDSNYKCKETYGGVFIDDEFVETQFNPELASTSDFRQEDIKLKQGIAQKMAKQIIADEVSWYDSDRFAYNLSNFIGLQALQSFDSEINQQDSDHYNISNRYNSFDDEKSATALPVFDPAFRSIPTLPSSASQYQNSQYSKGVYAFDHLKYQIGLKQLQDIIASFIKRENKEPFEAEKFLMHVESQMSEQTDSLFDQFHSQRQNKKNVSLQSMNFADWMLQWLQTQGMNDIFGTFDISFQQAPMDVEPEQNQQQPHSKQESPDQFSVIQIANYDNFPQLRTHAPLMTLFSKEANGEISSENFQFCVNSKQPITRIHSDVLKFSDYEGVLLNSDNRAYVRTLLDEKSLAWFKLNVSALPSPTHKHLVWLAMFTNVKEGSMTSLEFRDTIMAQTAKEKDFRLLAEVYKLGRVAMSERMTPRQHQELVKNAFFDQIHQRLLDTDPKDQDMLRVLRPAMIASAYGPEQVRKVLDWYQQQDLSLNKYDLSLVDEWDIIIKAHESAFVSKSEKDQILNFQNQIDASKYGTRMEQLCQAMQADTGERHNIWKSYLHYGMDTSNDKPLSHVIASMKGFNHSNLLEKSESDYYRARYFEALEKVYSSKQEHFKNAFGLLLLPESEDFKAVHDQVGKKIQEIQDKQSFQEDLDLQRQLLWHREQIELKAKAHACFNAYQDNQQQKTMK